MDNRVWSPCLRGWHLNLPIVDATHTHTSLGRLIALNHFSVSHDDSGRSSGLTVNIVAFFSSLHPVVLIVVVVVVWADHLTEWLSQS